MRLGVSLLAVTLVVAVGAAPATAQLPGLRLPDLLKTVEETTKKVVDDTEKAVEDTERAVRELVDRTIGPAPAPGGSDGGGDPGTGGGGGGPGEGDEPGADDEPEAEAPDEDESGGGSGGGGSGGGGGGGSGEERGSAPATKDGRTLPSTPGTLGGPEDAAAGNATLAVSRPRAPSNAEPIAPESGTGAEALSGDSRDMRSVLEPAVAVEAGPVALAVLALALMCLLVGTGGGLRALYGRLRGA